MILGYPGSAAFYLASFSDWFYRFVQPLFSARGFDAQAAVPFWVSGLDVSPELVESDDVVGAIVERTGDYDFTIIGATQEGLLQELVFGAIPKAVGQRAENTVVMTKRNLGITSQLKRWLRRE